MGFTTLNLFEPYWSGNGPIGDMTALFSPSWRRTKQRRGGHRLGSVDLSSQQLTRPEMDEIFTYGLARELRERGGGRETWRGLVMKMEYQRGDDLFVRDLSVCANAVRSIYNVIGDNLLTNGSGEAGVWSAYPSANAHLTIEQSTTWIVDGVYSMHITVTDTVVRGATIQSAIPIVAGVGYVIAAAMRVVSGSWRFSSNRADNDQILAFYSTHGDAGDHRVDVSIADTQTYTGNVDLRVTSERMAGEIYVDAVVFRTAARPAETGWYIDADAVKAYGRKEEILLRGELTDSAANDECRTLLSDLAWPRTLPPSTASNRQMGDGDKLTMIFAGYFALLKYLYTTQTGTRARSTWVNDLAALQPVISIDSIAANARTYSVTSTDPLRVGDILKDIVGTGDESGERYALGVHEARRLRYAPVASEVQYLRRGQRLFNIDGSEVEPWLAEPGWALWQDMPIGPTRWTGNTLDNPRLLYIEQVEMLPAASGNPNDWPELHFNSEEGSEAI